jgi:alginate O-acetyltransferase complex protein AlgI
MLFYSPLFLFIFLPLVLSAVMLTRGRTRDFVLLGGSAFFYFWGEPRFVFVVVLSAAADYFVCRRIHTSQGKGRAKWFMILGVALNLSVLVYFKYLDFFIDSVDQALAAFGLAPIPRLDIVLPIGVSFIVFEKITYLVDVYRKRGKPAHSFTSYLLYVLLFPKLLAGPIVKYHDIAGQLVEHRLTKDGLIEGFERFLLGLVKKVLIADTLGEVADIVFGLPHTILGFSNAWLGVVCFTFQIYVDFSGYSDMAIGLARMFGFRLQENFNWPYVAASFTEFWRRWHISLSTWIREYVYFSLGGNRTGVARTYLNLWVCFLLCGLWHGAKWTFILWGIYNGVFLILDKLFWLEFSKRLPRAVSIGATFLFVMLGWIIFRASSVQQMLVLIEALLSPSREGAVVYIAMNVWVALAAAAFVSFLPGPGVFEDVARFWKTPGFPQALAGWALAGLSLFAIGKAVAVTFKPFLYFRF